MQTPDWAINTHTSPQYGKIVLSTAEAMNTAPKQKNVPV